MNMTRMLTLMAIVGVLLSGCASLSNAMGKRNNGSLNYQDSHKLDPIALPVEQSMAQFTPLYPTPSVGQNTLNLTNDAGKQYQLPKPPQVR